MGSEESPKSGKQPEDYESPRVEDIPTEDGPAVTAAAEDVVDLPFTPPR